MNARHHSHALWGLGLALDPDYPQIYRFFPKLVNDTVLEYRSYALIVLWGALLAAWLPVPALWTLIAIWTIQSFRRAGVFRSQRAFWQQAFKESPGKMRVRTQYAQAVMTDIEVRMKAGESWDALQTDIDLGTRLIEEIAHVGTVPGLSS